MGIATVALIERREHGLRVTEAARSRERKLFRQIDVRARAFLDDDERTFVEPAVAQGSSALANETLAVRRIEKGKIEPCLFRRRSWLACIAPENANRA